MNTITPPAAPASGSKFSSLPFSRLPGDSTVSSVAGEGLQRGTFIHFSNTSANRPIPLGILKDVRRQLATYRLNPWSLGPAFGKLPTDVPDETVMLLWEKESGGYGVLIPLVDAGQRAWLGGTEDGLELRIMPWDKDAAEATLLFTAEGDDPFALVERSIELIAERLRTFRPRQQKRVPEWIDWFGWCTWDAFYQEVNTAGVLAGLEKARAGGVEPRFLILDDGWQDTDGKMLQGFGTHPQKIPEGLAALIRQVKEQFDIRLFGAWHAFEGYWYGVDPEGPAGKPYRVFDVTQSAHNRPQDEPARRVLVHPDDIARFYHDYYRELRRAGVDFVKVDNQGSLDHFLNAETTPPTPTMQRYQEAFQSAAAHHFKSETLHCLSQVGDVLFHLDSANVMRNSEDYFPTRPETQGQHVFRNALNNVFMGTFCIPDWDMFQSSRPAAAFHAAARAICGGPIYISDKPGEQNFDLLRQLITREGRALRCPQPALPTRDSLFNDAWQNPHLFKIQNRNGITGVLGLFNCHWDADGGKEASGPYSANDIDGLSGRRFALYHYRSGKLEIVDRDDFRQITLPPLEWELVTVAPVSDGVAIIGLTNKMNGSAAIRSQRWLTPDLLEIVLYEAGPLAFYFERQPSHVRAGTEEMTLTRPQGGAWIAELPGTTVTLEFTSGNGSTLAK